jgi:hypothetical protein
MDSQTVNWFYPNDCISERFVFVSGNGSGGKSKKVSWCIILKEKDLDIEDRLKLK